MSLLPSIFGFILCTAVIVYAGTKLSFFGDRIAGLTGLSKVWAGLILIISVIFLHELITGISAVIIVKISNFSAGDIFDSCVFNLLILCVLEKLD